jgi:Fe-S-cluster containining protein
MITSADLDRLCVHLGLTRAQFVRSYLEEVGGKQRVQTANGWCIFFADGCLVHPVKPLVCRVWPFFQGNMLDELSWQMAQVACPGINPETGHAQFMREGLKYLREMDLVLTNEGPNALNFNRCKAAKFATGCNAA